MYMRTLGLRVSLLSSAALLALSSGCASSLNAPTRMAHSHHDPTVVASRQDKPSYVRENRPYRSDDQRTMQSAATKSQARSDSTLPAYDRRTVQTADRGTDTFATQQDRVTVVSAEKPPLTKAEIPSRTIGGDEFWVAGHWFVASNGFSWQEGRIERDRTGELYCPAGWAASSRGWVFTPEYWR